MCYINPLQVTLERSDCCLVGDPMELQLLQMVVQMIGAKKTLDIGENRKSISAECVLFDSLKIVISL